MQYSVEKVTFGKWACDKQSWGLPYMSHVDHPTNIYKPDGIQHIQNFKTPVSQKGCWYFCEPQPSPDDLTMTTKRFCSYHYPWVEPFRSSQEHVFAMIFAMFQVILPPWKDVHSTGPTMLSWDFRSGTSPPSMYILRSSFEDLTLKTTCWSLPKGDSPWSSQKTLWWSVFDPKSCMKPPFSLQLTMIHWESPVISIAFPWFL